MKNCTNVNREWKNSFKRAKVKLWSLIFFNYIETRTDLGWFPNYNSCLTHTHTFVLLIYRISFGLCNNLSQRYCADSKKNSIKIQKFIGRINGKHRKSENFFHIRCCSSLKRIAMEQKYTRKKFSNVIEIEKKNSKSYGHS